MKNLSFLGYPHYCVTIEGKVYSLYSNKFLSDNKMLGEYRAVTLCEDGKRQETLIHRLVALAFIDNPDDKPCVNHIDGDKLNNHVSNLEWVTHKENTTHAMESGLRRSTVINDYRKLPDQTVYKICDMIEQGGRNKDISSMFDIPQGIVSAIKAGKYYKDISEQYNFRKIPSANRISEQKIIKICNLLSEKNSSVNTIARSCGVSFSVVKNIKDRKTYTYISNNYEW